MKHASWGERLIAIIIDLIILTVLERVLPIGSLYYDILPQGYESGLWETLSNFEFLIYTPFYFVGMRFWNNGQTLGKKAVGIQTVTNNGKKLGLFECMIDCAGYYIVPIDWLLGVFFSDSEHQRLTQMCAGTVVIKRER